MATIFNRENIGTGITWKRDGASIFIIHFVDPELSHHLTTYKRLPRQMIKIDSIFTDDNFVFLSDEYLNIIPKSVIVIDYFDGKKFLKRTIPFKEGPKFKAI